MARPDALPANLAKDRAVARAFTILESQNEPTLEEIVRADGVSQDVYLDYIKNQLSDEEACLELGPTLLLLVSFCALALLRLKQHRIFAVEETIEFDIMENANFAWAHYFGHKGLYDVNAVADFWSWFRLGFIPLIIQPEWYYSEGIDVPGSAYDPSNLTSSWVFPGYDKPCPQTNDYLRYNKIVGGIRMQQDVVPPGLEGCRWPLQLESAPFFRWLGKECYASGMGELSINLPDTEVFSESSSLRRQWLLPEIDSLDELTTILLDMEDGCLNSGPENCRCTWCKKALEPAPWINEGTQRVEIAFVVFNPTYGLYSYIGTNFFFNRGGHIQKFINVMSAWSDPYGAPLEEQIPIWIADAVFIFSLSKVFFAEMRELRHVVASSTQRCYVSIWNDYIALWNIIDWTSIIVGAIVCCLWVRCLMSVQNVNGQYAEYIMLSNTINATEPGARAMMEETVTVFFEHIEVMANYEKDFRTSLCIYPMIGMMRLFKSFAAQPRLAVVTKTLSASAQDMLHFGIVFCSVFVCFVVGSILLFGQDVQDFSNLPRALHTCFRATFGDWDWDAMKEVGQVKSGMWFWAFMLLMVLLLLNMLLGIILDAYTCEKTKAKGAVTLPTQISEMYRRWRQFRNGDRVRLNDIMDSFMQDANGDLKSVLESRVMWTPQMLLTKVPRIRENQALRTLVNAVKKKQEAESMEITEQDTLNEIDQRLQSTERRASATHGYTKYISERVSYYDRLHVPQDPEYDYHFGGDVDGLSLEARGLEENINNAVTDVSEEICSMLLDTTEQIEARQEALEKQQDELHNLVAEMQVMVAQSTRCVRAMAEATAELVAEHPDSQAN